MWLTFGKYAFEFVRRALNEESKNLQSWNIYKLGEEFIKRCQGFNPEKVNILPLLHASICRGRFLEAHNYFCKAINNVMNTNEENYFIATGKQISDLLINNMTEMASVS
ncbi:MAG TPA: hypothetical protein GX497_13235 [Bacillus bacterium]|nr:hypothetical protein [Bacillus sp. (in: firmicutes)]